MRRSKFFNLTRGQRMGVIGLSILAFILILLNIILPPIWNKKQYEKFDITWVIDSTSSVPAEKYVTGKIKKEPSNPSSKYKKKENVVVEINAANQAELKKIRGIGDVLSQRIINYREVLGGFHDKNQIKEVYGINDSVYNVIKNQIVVNKNKIIKINFNQASYEELKRHPYISDQLAKQVVSFRSKVKNFEFEQDVKKLYLMDDDLFIKLEHYIEY